MNTEAVNEGAGLVESLILEVHDRDTGRLKQRTTVKDGKETIERFPEEVQ